eukprot:scpid82237/ scgid5249/ 
MIILLFALSACWIIPGSHCHDDLSLTCESGKWDYVTLSCVPGSNENNDGLDPLSWSGEGAFGDGFAARITWDRIAQPPSPRLGIMIRRNFPHSPGRLLPAVVANNVDASALSADVHISYTGSHEVMLVAALDSAAWDNAFQSLPSPTTYTVLARGVFALDHCYTPEGNQAQCNIDLPAITGTQHPSVTEAPASSVNTIPTTKTAVEPVEQFTPSSEDNRCVTESGFPVTIHWTPRDYNNGDTPFSEHVLELVSRPELYSSYDTLLASVSGDRSKQRVMIKRRGRHFIYLYLVLDQPPSSHVHRHNDAYSHEPLSGRAVNLEPCCDQDSCHVYLGYNPEPTTQPPPDTTLPPTTQAPALLPTVDRGLGVTSVPRDHLKKLEDDLRAANLAVKVLRSQLSSARRGSSSCFSALTVSKRTAASCMARILKGK